MAIDRLGELGRHSLTQAKSFKLGLLASTCILATVADMAVAQDSVVANGVTLTTQLNMDDSDTLVVEDGGAIATTTNAVNVNCTSPCTNVLITNSGSLTGDQRGINSFVNVAGGGEVARNITIVNNATGLIQGGVDGIRMQSGANLNPATGSVISITNAGTIRTTDTNNQQGIEVINIPGATLVIDNQAGGLIEGPIGIQSNLDSTITNGGTIQGLGYNSTGEAIRLTGGGDSTVNLLAGSVTTAGAGASANGNAVSFTGSGTNTVNMEAGATVNGRLRADGSSLTDVINLIGSGAGTLGATTGFDFLNVVGGDWSSIEATTAAQGITIADGTSFTFLDNPGGGGGDLRGPIVNDGLLVQARTGFVTQDASSPISGTGDIAITGAGTWTFTVANTYSGSTTITDGQLRGDGDNLLSANSAHIVEANGILNIAPGNVSYSQEIGSLAGDGVVRLGTDTGANSLTLGGDNTPTTFGGTIEQLGDVRKIGSGAFTLTGDNTFSGQFILDSGTLTLAATGDLSGITGIVMAGGTMFDISGADGDRSFAQLEGGAGSSILLGANSLTLTYASGAEFAGTISGIGGLTKDGSATLTLSDVNNYSGATTIVAGGLLLTGTGAIDSSSALNLNDPTSTFDLAGASGDRIIGALSGVAGSNIVMGGNSLTVGDGADTEFAGVFSGTGGVTKTGTGLLTLSGVNTATGLFALEQGGLMLTGELGGDATAAAATLFDGTGTVAGTLAIDDNAVLRIGDASVGVLTVGGLILNPSSILIYDLGAPDVIAASDRIQINGDLVLDGQLQANDIGSFGAGVYRLIDVTGTITNNGLSISSLPSGFLNSQGTVQVLDASGQVNLVISADVPGLQFWDGSGTVDDGTIAGGSGSWTNALTNWTNADGTNNSNWLGGFAVFQATAGTVTVDDAILSTGMQFMTDGYEVASGTGSLSITEAQSSFRVDPGVAATISADIGGTGGLFKQDAGTLILSGTNSYAGETLVDGGTVELQSGSAIADLGAVSVSLGATLLVSGAETIGSLAGAGTVQLDADLDTGGNDAATQFTGTIAGSGSLTKSGTGIFTLGGSNTYSGGTIVAGGTLLAGAQDAFGSGILSVLAGTSADLAGFSATIAGVQGNGSLNLGAAGGGLAVNVAGTATFNGVISGESDLTKQGAGTQVLAGDNSYTGATLIDAGTLALSGAGAITSSSSVTLAAGSTFDITAASGDRSVKELSSIAGSSIVLGSNTLTAVNSTNSEIAGSLTGTGGLTKQGAGMLYLSGTSTATGALSVESGAVMLTGSYAGGALLADGTSFGGDGSLLGTLDVGSAVINPGVGGVGTLTLGGLTLSAGSVLNYDLGAPDALGASDLIQVNGNLTLDGTVNGADAGGFGAGVYRIIDYTGSLTDNGLLVGSLGGGYDPARAQVQTSISGQINLIVAESIPDIQFWDGGNTTANDAIDGGSGSWNITDTNWTGADGGTNDPWNGKFAVFAGTAGTVSVDAQIGPAGIQFMTDGYVLSAGSGSLVLSDAATSFRVDPSVTATINAPITGSGGLLKNDTGTLVLGGANTYTGVTDIAFGTLRVAGGQAVANTGKVTIADGAVFDVAASETVGSVSGAGDILLSGATLTTGGLGLADALSGDISGTGGLTKLGGSAFTLSGANTYSGATDIQAGSIVGKVGSGDLNVAAGATLDQGGASNAVATLTGGGSILFAGNNFSAGAGANSTFSGKMSGSGNFTKTGSGALTLSGASTFTGTTLVSAGTLIVNGSLASSVSVASGASLGGSGTVGGLTLNGEIKPGNSIGTMQVNGDVGFAAGSTYTVEVLPNGSSDLLAATGSVTINGGTVSIQAGGADYANLTEYTIITANTVSGAFDGVTSNLAFLDPTLIYNASSVQLRLLRNDVSFASIAGTPNGGAVGGALQGAGPGNALFDYVVNLDAATASRVFNAMTGEVQATVLAEAGRNAEHDRRPIVERMAAPVEPGVTMWADAGIIDREVDGSDGYLGLDGVRFSAAGGLEMGLSESAKIGAGYVYGNNDLSLAGVTSKSRIKTSSLFAYGAFGSGALSVRVGGGIGWLSSSSSRQFNVSSLSGRLLADEDGTTRQLFGELAYSIGRGPVAVEPFLGAAYAKTKLDGLVEQGGDTALVFDRASIKTTLATAGLRLKGKFISLGGTDWKLDSEAAFDHYFDDPRAVRNAHFAIGSPDFAVGATEFAGDALRWRLGVATETKVGEFAIGVIGKTSGAETDLGARIQATIRF